MAMFAGVVAIAQEFDEIPRRRKADAGHRRVLRGIDQLVDVVGVEIAVEADLERAGHARESLGRAVGEGPLAVGDELLRIILVHALRERGAGIVGTDCLIGGWRRHVDGARRRAVEDVLRPHPAGDRRAIVVRRHRQFDLDASGDVAFPAAPYQRVASFGSVSPVAVPSSCSY